jgi:hypothetical protein
MSLISRLNANAAKSGVHAARKSVSRALGGGQARVKEMVDASGRRADDSLDMVERAVIGVLDTLAARGRKYAKDGRRYAAQAGLLPRRRTSPLGAIIAGVGAGVLLSLLLAPRAGDRTVRQRSA